jgi:hypothetical protein
MEDRATTSLDRTVSQKESSNEMEKAQKATDLQLEELHKEVNAVPFRTNPRHLPRGLPLPLKE